MSALIDEFEVCCPYCGETITLVVDLTVAEQSYIEDCFVCCQPMQVTYRTEGGNLAGIEVAPTDD